MRAPRRAGGLDDGRRGVAVLQVRRAFALVLLLAAIVPLAGCEDGIVRGAVVYDGRHAVGEGETLEGDLVVLAGQAEIAPGATVRGSVWVLGGTCHISGAVEGDVNGLAGNLAVTGGARVGGDLVLGGGDVEVVPSATIEGRTTESLGPLAGGDAGVGDRLRTGLPAALLLGALTFAAAAWWHQPLDRVGAAALRHPVASLATGVMAGLTGLIIVVLVGFTLLLLPVALLMGLGGIAAVALGWAGLAVGAGGRLTTARWARAAAAAAAAASLVVVVTVVALAPWAGGALALLFAAWGLGATLLTRFGARTFRPATIPAVDEDAGRAEGS